jgi:hypothetical protein
MHVDVQALTILRATVRIVGPHEGAQIFGANARAAAYRIENPTLDWRQA